MADGMGYGHDRGFRTNRKASRHKVSTGAAAPMEAMAATTAAAAGAARPMGPWRPLPILGAEARMWLAGPGAA